MATGEIGLFTTFARRNTVVLKRFLRISSCFQCKLQGGKDMSGITKKKKMDDYFIDSKVQSILLKITGMDYAKIFRPRKEVLWTPKYEFVTDKKLKELQDLARQKALKKLQMPPVMEAREPIDEVLSYDPELQGYKDCNLVFIDTTSNISSRERFIVVREPDGTLRKANWSERFNMNQIFYPIPGRSLIMPKLFESEYLERLLDEESYIFVLDRACTQFEPDDPEYHRVTHATYEHINAHKKFDILRSTRHFGPMTFYLTWEKKMERLLVDMIDKELMSDAADLVKLFQIFHPELAITKEENMSDLDLVTAFISANSSVYKPDLELALQTYIESHHPEEVESEKTEAMS